MSIKIKNALISLSDKGELERLLKILRKFNINIISSGGTFTEIKKCPENNLGVQNEERYTSREL